MKVVWKKTEVVDVESSCVRVRDITDGSYECGTLEMCTTAYGRGHVLKAA